MAVFQHLWMMKILKELINTSGMLNKLIGVVE